MEAGSPGANLGAARIAAADFSVAQKKTKPVIWAGRLGWPPHPCPCRFSPSEAVRSRSMTRLGCRTQARRVFRQGKGIKPHFQHTPQYFSPICRCSGMCKTSLLDVDTVLGTDELGWESRRQLSPGRYFLAQPRRRNLPVAQAATTNINPNAT